MSQHKIGLYVRSNGSADHVHDPQALGNMFVIHDGSEPWNLCDGYKEVARSIKVRQNLKPA